MGKCMNNDYFISLDIGAHYENWKELLSQVLNIAGHSSKLYGWVMMRLERSGIKLELVPKFWKSEVRHEWKDPFQEETPENFQWKPNESLLGNWDCPRGLLYDPW